MPRRGTPTSEPVSLLTRILLWCYPAPFRRAYASDLAKFLTSQRLEPRYRNWGVVRFWRDVVGDAVVSGVRMRWRAVVGGRPPLKGPRRWHGQDIGLAGWLQDIRISARSLLRSPMYTAVAVVTLALGIGVNTAIFSVVNGVLLKPLPYAEPDHLTALWMVGEEEGDTQLPWSVPSLLDVSAENHSFEAMAGYQWSDATLTGLGDPELVDAVAVTNGLLRIFRQTPVLGRDIREEESVPGGPAVVVVSHAFWQERLGGDSLVLGRTIHLAGRAREIVGVAPPGFEYPTGAQLWIPGQWTPEAYPRGRHSLPAVGRLAPHVTLEGAQAELSGIVSSLGERYPATNYARGVNLISLEDFAVADVRLALLVLQGAVALVLLIACANVANLLLVRGSTRVSEIAVRATLGASRRALLRLLLTESLILSVAGGALGVILAVWGVRGFTTLAPGNIPRLDNVAIDGTVLLFAAGLALAVTLVFGLAPAARLTRISLSAVIREGRDEVGRVGERRFARFSLLAGEVALSLVLLLGAGLLLRSFAEIREVTLGFDTADVYQFNLTLPEAGYDDERAVEFYRTLDQRLSAIPGVEAVGMISGSPLGGTHTTIGFNILGRPQPPGGQGPDWLVRVASPGYFVSLRIPLLRGRGLLPSDRAAAAKVAVISREAARRYWPGEDAVGQQFAFNQDGPPWTVVGMVGDVRSLDLTTETYPEAYLAHAQRSRPTMTVMVRTTAGSEGLGAAIRREVAAMDPNLALYGAGMLEQRVASSVASEWFYLLLIGLFAGLAVVLAAVGLYGVVAYLVSRRTREIGIRVALGARRGDVVRLVVGQGLGPVAVGIVVGLGAALVGTRILETLLYQVEPWDPLTYGGCAVLLALVSLIASILPTLSATRISPTEAIKAV